ncbi:MAG: hypothetical protein BWK79_09975, partial [Beggiatoa sp. IS2]
MPSKWQHYLKNVDSTLSPDFALTDLQLAHWQRPSLKRLLLGGHGLWPLFISSLVYISLQLLEIPQDTIILTSCYAFFFSMMSGLLGSLTISVAFGIIVGIVGGLSLSLVIGLAGNVIFKMADNIMFAVVFSNPEIQAVFSNSNPYALLSVLFGIFTVAVAGSVMQNATIANYDYSPHRQIGSIVIGVFISAFIVLAIVKFISMSVLWIGTIISDGYGIIYDNLISGVFGLSLTFIWFLPTRQWRLALLLGLSATLLLAIATLLSNQFNTPSLSNTVLTGMHFGIENAIMYLLLFAFPYGLAKRIANPWAGVMAGIFASAGLYITFALMTELYPSELILSTTLLALVLGLSINGWRPLLFYPFCAAWNLLLHRADEKRVHSSNSLLYWHSVFWDEQQYLPLWGLEDYLVMITERFPTEGKFALELISNTAQNWAAQKAQIELDARRLQNCHTVEAIGNAHRQLAAGELPGPVSTLLRSFSRTSRDVEAALAQESKYNQRLALSVVEEHLDGSIRELTRSSEPYNSRFQPIAAAWRRILSDYLRILNEAVENRQEIHSPYVIGIPLTEHQEIFVGRSDISERIEKLLLDCRCPPLLLYGQRRTGKTSLLNNLGKLLPSTIIPLFVDLQGPASLAKNYEGFLYNIGRAILASAKRHRSLILPPLTRDNLQNDPFTSFDEWLDSIEQHLDADQTLLLTLDEFSALEHAFTKQLLDEVLVLGMFRHIIQHRPRFKILLSGSQTIDEFERWASYLINVQTVHISYLQANEARRLVERPVKDFSLRYEPAASQRVLEITHGHPALIQLVCGEIVAIKNKQPIHERRLARVEDVEMAVPGALQHGRFFFADIANNQVTADGLTMLRFLATHGENTVVMFEDFV